MIDNIIRFSLHNRLAVFVGALLVVIGGIWSMREMDIDVFPDLTAPTVVVMTDCNGLAAEEVERLVSFHIETALNGATNVRRVRSASMSGYSFVWAEFDWGMDVMKARQIVSEKMATINDALPEGIMPEMAPQSSVMGEILFIGLQSDTTSMMDLHSLAEWVIKPNILATGGVSQVTVMGGEIKEYQIVADPIKMSRNGIGMNDIETAAKSLTIDATGGTIRDYNNEYSLRTMGRTSNIDEIGRTLVGMNNGKPVCIADVADVRIGTAIPMGYASHNAKPSIIISVSKQPNINTLAVTNNIERNLKGIIHTLPADVTIDTTIFRQADFIEAAVGNVGRALAEGAIFVIIVLALFLGSMRTTIISIVAMPLSLLATIIVLYFFGMDINTMTLGGMCIAIGSLVDDAIIDVENVYKRLRENHIAKTGRSTINIVFEASKEIRTSIINATLIIIVAFIPLFFLSGMEGRMLKPLGIAFIVALFMSLIVAMTITPLLCKTLLSSDSYLTRNESESRLVGWLKKIYTSTLSQLMKSPKVVAISAIMLIIAAATMFFTMGSSFLPDFNEGSMTISAVTKAGVSLDVSDEIGTLMERTLLDIPEVKSTSRRTGRGDLDEHSQATNSAELDVNFELTDRSRDELFNDVRKRLNAIPGVAVTVGQPLGHRIDHILSGTRANIAIKIFGTDLSQMQIIGNQIKGLISEIDGCVDVNVEQQTETPQIQIRPKRDAMAKYGITMQQLNDFTEQAFAGKNVGSIYEGQRSFDLTIRLADRYSRTIEGIRNAPIQTAFGGCVALSEICEIISASGPNTISRENVQRKLVVSANVSGRDMSAVVDEIESTINKNISLPESYRIEYGGQFESAKSASRTLMITTIIALLIIFMLLISEFRNISLATIVMATLPMSLIGGIFAVWFTSGVISIPSTIGFITLFGIATRNGVLLITKYETLLSTNRNLNECIVLGSLDRLNPILMTALTSALALIPLVINGDKSGNEIQSPMAIVVLGGLLTSTLLNLYAMPIIYKWFKTKQDK